MSGLYDVDPSKAWGQGRQEPPSQRWGNSMNVITITWETVRNNSQRMSFTPRIPAVKHALGKGRLCPQASRDRGKSQFPEGKSADESGTVCGQLSRDLAEKQ